MKVRALVRWGVFIAIVSGGLLYISNALVKSAAPPEPARTPSLAQAPVRIYGRIEPRGREVFVSPLQPGRVTQILVHEGDLVATSQPLCELESSVEQQALMVAEARVQELEAKLAVVLDELKRIRPLLGTDAVSEISVSQKQLESEVLRRQISTAKAEAELKRKELDLRVLRAPIDGRVYKFDVRLGEYLTPQDAQRIILGDQQKQVRLFVESFWVPKVKVGDSFAVLDAETFAPLGKGRITYVAEYTGMRDFRTEDALERLDTRYAQAVLEFDGEATAPLGLLVLCERPENANAREGGKQE